MKTATLITLCFTFLLINLSGYSQNGLTCLNAIQIIENPTEIMFPEEETTLYIDFTASSDNILIELATHTNNSLPIISKIEIYSKFDCSNLTLLYDYDDMDSIYHYSQLLSLEDNEDYLYVLKRDPNGDLSEAYLNFIMQSFITSVCTPYTPCESIFKNGDFEKTNTQNFDPIKAFNFGQVCDWISGSASPQLIPDIGGDLACKMYTRFYIDSYNVNRRASETVVNSFNFNNGQNYIITFKLRKFGSDGLPDQFKVRLYRDIDLGPNGSAISNVSSYEEVISVPKNQISTNGNYSTFSFCITPTADWDRIAFFPFSTTLIPWTNPTHQWVVLDDIHIREVGNFAGPNLSKCSNSNVIGPDCPIPGATYSWSPPTDLSNANIPNPIATPSSPTTYTLNITLPGTVNCSLSLTDQVLVDNTPTLGTWVIPDGADLSWFTNNNLTVMNTTPVSSFLAFPCLMEVTGYNFIVEGDLFIDNFYDPNNPACGGIVFRNNTFLVSNGGAIIANQELIVGSNNIFTSCSNTYWEGIKVNPGGSTRFYNSTIERANIAFNVDDGNVTIENNQIINNKKAVNVSKLRASSLLNIKLNNFSSIPHPLSSGGSFLPSVSIELDDIDLDLNISNAMRVISDNNFDGSSGAIKIHNSSLDLIGNTFEGYNNLFTFPGQPNKTEYSILIVGDNSHSRKVSIESNNFLSSKEGIISNNDYELDILNNNYNTDDNTPANFYNRVEGSRFITLTDNFKQVNISDNDIYNADIGINAVNSNFLDISNNFIDLEYQSNYTSYNNKQNQYSVGIKVGKFNLFAPFSTVNISYNEIWHSKIGILTEFTNSYIHDNEVFDLNDNMSANSPCFPYTSPCPPSPAYGIRAMNELSIVQSNKVYNNSSHYTVSPRSNQSVIGISLENTGTTASSFASAVECNNVENTGVGLQFSGNQSTNITVQFNKMKNHTKGLLLSNGGVIGDLGSLNNASDNRWDWTTATGERHTFADNSFGGNSTIYTRTASPYEPSINTFVDKTPGYTAFNKNTGNTPASAGCTTPNLSVNRGKTTNLNKSGSRRAYGHLIVNNSRIANDSMRILDKQLLYLNLLSDSVEYSKIEWKRFIDSMKLTPLHRLLNSDSIVLTRGSSQDAKVNQLNSISKSISNSSKLNNGIKRNLLTIASLCPYEDGIAVYLARNILEKYNERVIVNDCEKSIRNINLKRLSAEELDSKKESFNIYPNPSSNLINFEFIVGEMDIVSIELIDIHGRIILKKRLSEAEFHQIPISDIKDGLYIVRILNQNEELQKTRIVVAK